MLPLRYNVAPAVVLVLMNFIMSNETTVSKKLKLALIGGGFLNGIVAGAVKNGLLPEYDLVAVLERPGREGSLAKSFGCKVVDNIDALLAERPDYVAEAASGDAVRAYAEAILRGGANLVVLSIGAFADEAFFKRVSDAAAAAGKKVHIASGAVGGFDVLRTAALMGPVRAAISAFKSPASVARSPLGFDGILNVTEPTSVFRGTTKEAIAILPHQVNVAVATALASAGPAETQMDINVLPGGFVGDEYHIKIEGGEVATNLQIYSRTSAVAGWSVVAALRNIVSPVEFF